MTFCRWWLLNLELEALAPAHRKSSRDCGANEASWVNKMMNHLSHHALPAVHLRAELQHSAAIHLPKCCYWNKQHRDCLQMKHRTHIVEREVNTKTTLYQPCSLAGGVYKHNWGLFRCKHVKAAQKSKDRHCSGDYFVLIHHLIILIKRLSLHKVRKPKPRQS